MTVKVVIELAGGGTVEWAPPINDRTIRRLTLATDEGPVMVQLFSIHDGGRLHTICSRRNNRVREVEW